MMFFIHVDFRIIMHGFSKCAVIINNRKRVKNLNAIMVVYVMMFISPS